MNKKGMELEYVVKAILALLVLVIIAGVLYFFVVKKAGGGIGIITDTTAEEGDGVLDKLRDLLGNSCEEGSSKCSLSGKEMTCEDGKWIVGEDPCESES